MVVYRVYEAYHDSSESGTYEFGTYSTLEKAKDRLATIWAERKYPKPDSKSDFGWNAYPGYERVGITIETIELDVDVNGNNCGYT